MLFKLLPTSPPSGSRTTSTFPGICYATPDFQYQDACLLPIAAVKNCHRHNGLKWHPFITSQFCRSDAWAGLTGFPTQGFMRLKSRCWPWLSRLIQDVSKLRSHMVVVPRSLFSYWLLTGDSACRDHLHPWLVAPFSDPPDSLFWPTLLPSVMTLGHLDNPGQSFCFKVSRLSIIIPCAACFLPCNVICPQGYRRGRWPMRPKSCLHAGVNIPLISRRACSPQGHVLDTACTCCILKSQEDMFACGFFMAASAGPLPSETTLFWRLCFTHSFDNPPLSHFSLYILFRFVLFSLKSLYWVDASPSI